MLNKCLWAISKRRKQDNADQFLHDWIMALARKKIVAGVRKTHTCMEIYRHDLWESEMDQKEGLESGCSRFLRIYITHPSLVSGFPLLSLPTNYIFHEHLVGSEPTTRVPFF